MKTKTISLVITIALLCNLFSFVSYGVRENDIDCFTVLLKEEYYSQSEAFLNSLKIDEIEDVTIVPIDGTNKPDGFMYVIYTKNSSEEAAGKVYSMLISDERVSSVTPDYEKTQELVKEEKELQKISCMLPFDVNGDGAVTAADARETLRASVGLRSLDLPALKAIGVSDEKSITASEVRKILRISVGLEKAPRFIINTESENERIVIGPLECNGSAGFFWELTGDTESFIIEEKSYGAYSLEMGGTVNFYYILTPKNKGLFRLNFSCIDVKLPEKVSEFTLEVRNQVHVCELPGPDDEIWK